MSHPSASSHATFYRAFGRPTIKVFLMSIFVYQVTYYGWYKLEVQDTKIMKSSEIKRLTSQLQGLRSNQTPDTKRGSER